MSGNGTCRPERATEALTRPLVRAHRWRRQIESGQARSITDLAEQEGVTDAYVCRLLPLTCLAPDIMEAILEGRQPKGLRLAVMLGNGPLAGTSSGRTGASAIDIDVLMEAVRLRSSIVALSSCRGRSGTTSRSVSRPRRWLKQTTGEQKSEPAHPICARKQP
jgi:hypothetical protein